MRRNVGKARLLDKAHGVFVEGFFPIKQIDFFAVNGCGFHPVISRAELSRMRAMPLFGLGMRIEQLFEIRIHGVLQG